MSKNSERICICFRPDELEIFDELCLKKGYFRSRFEFAGYVMYENYGTYEKYVTYEKYADIVYIRKYRKEFEADGHK